MDAEQIILVKLISGEIYIGQEEFNEEQEEILREAYMIQIIPTAQTSFNVMMVPVFAPLSSDCVDLNVTKQVLSKTTPKDDLKNQYIAARTNLVVGQPLPKNKPVLIGE